MRKFGGQSASRLTEFLFFTALASGIFGCVGDVLIIPVAPLCDTLLVQGNECMS